jgi:CHASE2 domain-containing sensor protein
VIEHLGWFEHLQAAIVDTFSRGLTHEVPKDILIVEITDENYEEFFGQQSPLNPNIVIQLIKSVEQLRPTVIGVDLDTRDGAWAKADLRHLEHLMQHIVWAGVPEEASTPEENPSGLGDLAPLRLLPVLGGHVDPNWPVGVVRFPTGPDGFVRAFRCSYPVETKSKPMPAFFHLVAHQGRSDLGSPDLGEGDGENPYLKFSGDRYHFQKVQASEFIELDPGSSTKKDARLNQQRSGTNAQNDPRMNVQMKHIPAELASRIANRIVLIGGAYGMARDEYLTPLGKMAGVELLANAVETEMHGGVRALTWRILVPVDILMGSLIVFIYFQLPGKLGAALLWSLLAIFAAPLLVGLISFYGMTAFLNFAPIMFGMLVHQMYEGTKETVKLHGEVAEKERVIEKLKAALQEARQPSSNLQVSHPTAMASAAPSDPASVLRATIVESGTEELHVQDSQEPPRRRRGHAAGK